VTESDRHRLGRLVWSLRQQHPALGAAYSLTSQPCSFLHERALGDY
jgi:hypothetical protein